MMCRKPLTGGAIAFGCGQCLPCRLNRKRQWAHRLVLEGFCHADKAFVTLTLSEESLEYSVSDGGEFLATLVPEDVSSFVKRLRARVEPLRVRFYAVGEYGSKTERPHYHIVLFGYPGCLRGRTIRDSVTGECDWRRCCVNCRLIGEVWEKGIVELGECNFESFTYISRYVVKKWTSDVAALRGRHPEFCRMSLRPGIGADHMHEVASILMQYGLEERNVVSLDHGKVNMPLGRYLSGKLRELVGVDPKCPQYVLDLLKSELSLVRQAAWSCQAPVSSVLTELDRGRYEALEAKSQIWKGKDAL